MSKKPIIAPVEPKQLKNYGLRVRVNCFQFSTTVSATDITNAYEVGYKQLEKTMSKKSKSKIDVLEVWEISNENGG